MKKIIVFLIVLMGLTGVTAFAAPGDIAGEIYATDIKAYINGVQVDSYNIGGKTVVIVEDITAQCEYSEQLRTLLFWDLSPDSILPGTKENDHVPGTPVGNIYETDIKTIIRGKELPCWSLNGKMAVAIEELGADGDWSEIGGKFVWNAEERTISLEFMHGYKSHVHYMLRNKHLNMVLKEVDGVLTAELVSAPILNGFVHSDIVVPDGSINPIFYDGEIIGYKCKFPNTNFIVDENGNYSLETADWQVPVDHLYVDKIEEIVKDIQPAQPTYEDWLAYFDSQMYTVISELETDDYHFLYMSQPNTHGSSQFMRKIYKKDGELHAFDVIFESVSLHGNKHFDDVTIDEENRKVYFGYDTWYVIDLETNQIGITDKPES